MILGLIFAAIFVYVGVNLIPEILPATANITEANGYSSGVVGLQGVIVIVFAAIIILGVVKQFTTVDDSGSKSIKVKLVKNTKSLVLAIERASENLEQYLNNLDELLGIETVIDDEHDYREYGLELVDNKLLICGGDSIWHWYLAEKHPEMDIFKVVGLHKNDATKNVLYLLGRNSGADKTYLHKLPEKYLEQASVQECIRNAGVGVPRREVVEKVGV